MSQIGNKIIGAGLCLEGIEFERLEKEILRLNKTIESTKPICPFCKTVMIPARFCGYYDTFDYWGCNCDKISGAEKNKCQGQYA